MRTRSKSYQNNSNAIISRRQNRRRVPNIVKPEIGTIEEVVPMADRTMEELLQAPMEGNQPSVCAATGTYNQVSPPNRASNQIPPPVFAPVQNNENRYNQNQGQGSFFQNQASTSGTLPSNIVPNPKGEMKAVTTRNGLAYAGPLIPTNSPLEKVVERETEETTNKEKHNCQGSTTHIQPPVVPISIHEPDVSKTQPKPNIPYPSRLNDQKLREKATNQMEKFFQIFHDFHFDISFADALLLMPKFASTNLCHALADLGAIINLMPLSIWKKLSLPELTPTRMTLELADRFITHPKGVVEDVFVKVRKFHFPTDFVVVDFDDDPRVPLILGRSFLRTDRALIDVYGEEITLWVNDESYNSKSSNPTLVSNHSFSEETKKIEDFLKDESIPTGIEDSFYDPEGDILYLEKLLNDDPSQLPPMDLKQKEETKAKYSIEEPPELEMKELPSHLEYSFLEETDKLPVIIAKDLKDVEKEALLKVLKSHKRAIA
uniref:Reverse transcriptase domain-containing protein n=1 Tax=Tanacetum cinerariifolium TaxID=118510 RepID=A0A6L2N7F8_TANCI|nr:hypothetical protein [Tanacetum cinerariifolium]